MAILLHLHNIVPWPIVSESLTSTRNQPCEHFYPYAEGAPYQLGDWQNDLENLLLHEVGHTLGLGHSDDQGAIMCVLPTCNEIVNLQRTLGGYPQIIASA